MPVIFIFLSSNQAGSYCDNRKDYTIFPGKMTVKKLRFGQGNSPRIGPKRLAPQVFHNITMLLELEEWPRRISNRLTVYEPVGPD